MKKIKDLIIGAGISGLTYANYTKNDYLIVEKDDNPGGYCRTIVKGDYIWDYAGHFFHFKNEEFKKKFIDNMSSEEFINKNKMTYIYYKDLLIDYPFQTNIHQLPKEEFIDCLYDLFNKEEKEEYENFLDMLYGKFGKSIVEKFLKPYNEKLYACDLQKLDKDAMGRFFPYADINAIINNMKQSKNESYNNTFIYPKKGAQKIIDILMENINKDNLMLNMAVKKIYIKEKKAVLENGEIIEFCNLINTIPINNFLKLLDNEEYVKLSDELSYNKVLVFNLGFDKKSNYNKEDWIYFPDKNINFYRVGFYDNILGSDKLSMYIEIGFDKNESIDVDKELKLTLLNLKKTKIIDEDFNLVDYVSIIMDPAYVHIDVENDKKIKQVKEELFENNIYSVGRYGGWTYCSMEDCMIEAKDLNEKINKNN